MRCIYVHFLLYNVYRFICDVSMYIFFYIMFIGLYAMYLCTFSSI